MTLDNLNLNQLNQVARQLAATLKSTPAVIGLAGPLGSGKTTFTKAFAAGLGIKRTKSPSFIIAHKYQSRSLILYHLDFYRLTSPKQLVNLGLDEILNRRQPVLIEWVDKFPKLMKDCDILIRFKINHDGTRTLQINAK